MTSPTSLFKGYLSTIGVVRSIFGLRIYEGMEAPEEYKIEMGAGMIIGMRSGKGDFSNKALTCMMQIRCYHELEKTALENAFNVYAVIQDKIARPILFIRSETLPVVLKDKLGYFGLVLPTITLLKETEATWPMPAPLR